MRTALSIALCLAIAPGCKKSSEAKPVQAPPAQKASLDRPETLNERAPDTYRASFATSKGDFVIEGLPRQPLSGTLIWHEER